MKRLRYTLPLALATFAITLTARPCGPDFPAAVFVLQTGPSGSYATYAAGRLGVPQSAYRTRHMVVAYDYLTSRPLSPAVQKDAVALNTYLLDPWQSDNNKPLDGFSAWITARTHFGPVDGYVPDSKLATDHVVPGQDYESFGNCLDGAFATAAQTLTARIAAHTAKDPAIADWVRAQDAVFTNCGDGKLHNYYGPPDKAPPPPPTPHSPATAPASAPSWLKQDRAYQLAAASFYHLDYDDALSRFHAIAADSASPWSVTARYLVARTYVRQATVAKLPAAMPLAQHELIAMQSDPRMSSMRRSIENLLDYLNIRQQPDAQAAVLAARLQSPNTATFRQALLDLTWLHSTRNFSDAPVPALSSAGHPNDMLAWIDAVSRKDEAAAAAHWQTTHSSAWLVAALANANPNDPATPELLKAARSASPTDPGWLAITYNRLRLSPQDPATRSEVLALLPEIKKTGDVSTINLFLTLSTATAPTLDAWLTTIPRTPAGDSSASDGEEVLPDKNLASTDAAVQSSQPTFVQDDCGNKYPANTVLPLFDADVAVALNRDMPLRLLALAAESSAVPPGLRSQIAQATWTRAVLLDKPEIARRMTPILIACRPAWKPVLTAYDSAKPDRRQSAALLALMRFASTVPSVWEGEDRRKGFATYDELRENWWCTTVPRPGETVDASPDRILQSSANTPSSQSNVPTPPSFLNQADQTEAHKEVAALERIPRASTYFAQRALAWQTLHPTDPQTPEILGQADRVVRNSCRKDPPYDSKGKTQIDPTDMTLTSNLAKALFETLHRNYPNSAWAKRYTSWE
jgi:hypothetical protein